MFKNLELEIVKQGFTKKVVAEKAGIPYMTFMHKMKEGDFTTAQAFDIASILNNWDIAYLFQKEAAPCSK